jgi:hypothetical protein
MAAIGQFDLKIYFRIPRISSSSSNYIIKNKYCIDWNIEVNQRRLIDHNIDSISNWNMKVNGKRLMDKEEMRINNPKTPDEEECYQYWNVPLPYDSSKPNEEVDDKLTDDQKKEREKCKKAILKMMNEEDAKAEDLKLLRPLYLILDIDKIDIDQIRILDLNKKKLAVLFPALYREHVSIRLNQDLNFSAISS